MYENFATWMICILKLIDMNITEKYGFQIKFLH